MKVKEENILTLAEGQYELKARQGAVTKIADQMKLAAKTISRALHADVANVSHENYVAIRSIALRDYEAYPIQVKRIKA